MAQNTLFMTTARKVLVDLGYSQHVLPKWSMVATYEHAEAPTLTVAPVLGGVLVVPANGATQVVTSSEELTALATQSMLLPA